MFFILKHKRFVGIVLVLEVLAVVFAMLQWHVGVRTDEAKYLLNIPYPHPPFGRWILHLLEAFPYQEIFWRIIFATLLMQAVWLVWDIGRSLSRSHRIILSGAWILSSAILLQAGTIMMAPITALYGLLFLWLLSRSRRLKSPVEYPGLIALLWLSALFSAYQAVLFAPLVWVLIRRSSWRLKSPVTQCVYVFIPVFLLGLYTLSNPLAIYSMFLQAGKDIAETPMERLLATMRVWAIGGSIITSVLGTAGMCMSLLRRIRRLQSPVNDDIDSFALAGSFFLVAMFTFLARHDYYAILWTPLFIAGLAALLQTRRANENSAIFGMLFLMFHLVFLLFFPVSLQKSPARETMRVIQEGQDGLPWRAGTGVILIAGAFGHEWQYESSLRVRRYSPDSDLSEVAAVICILSCPELASRAWQRLPNTSVEVWVQRLTGR